MSEELSINLTSRDFDKRSKDDLLQLFKDFGLQIFYHRTTTKQRTVLEFQPALLSSYFRIVYSIKTITSTNIRYPGDMYYYDYDRAIYLPNAEIKLTMLVKEWWGDNFLFIPLSKVFKDLRASTYIDREDTYLDAKYIPVANGILELYQDSKKEWKLKLVSNSPKHFVLNRVQARFDPSAKNPKQLMKFLNSSLKGQEKEITWIQEYVGYCLFRAWIFDYAMIWIGEGDNGKTTLLNTVDCLLGYESTVNISLQDLCHGRWYVAELWQKLANLKDDIADEDLRSTGKFKELTGGRHRVQGERKFRDPFRFFPTCKHIYTGNQIPYSPDSTEAFHRRWLPVDWVIQFQISNPDRDPFLEEKLNSPEELSAMLNWALEGLLRILNHSGFSDVPAWEERRARWEAQSNPVAAFIYDKECVAWGKEVNYRIEQFNEDLSDYCMKKKLPQWNQIRVGREIKKRFRGEIKKEYVYFSGEKTQINCYKGICPASQAVMTPEQERRTLEKVMEKEIEAKIDDR